MKNNKLKIGILGSIATIGSFTPFVAATSCHSTCSKAIKNDSSLIKKQQIVDAINQNNSILNYYCPHQENIYSDQDVNFILNKISQQDKIKIAQNLHVIYGKEQNVKQFVEPMQTNANWYWDGWWYFKINLHVVFNPQECKIISQIITITSQVVKIAAKISRFLNKQFSIAMNIANVIVKLIKIFVGGFLDSCVYENKSAHFRFSCGFIPTGFWKE